MCARAHTDTHRHTQQYAFKREFWLYIRKTYIKDERASVAERAGSFALCDHVDVCSYVIGVRIIISTSVFGLWSHPLIRVINPMKLD